MAIDKCLTDVAVAIENIRKEGKKSIKEALVTAKKKYEKRVFRGSS